MKKKMIEAMQHDFETVFKDKYDNNEVYLVAASSASKEETDKWVQEIKAAFPGMEVLCDDLSLGVSCHIGPGGLGIGCSCRPERTRK
jgi:fatty acid-binding protein DegV